MPLLRDMTLGQYYPGNSFLHCLDPRSKLISIVTLMTCLFISMEVDVLIAGGSLLTLGIARSGLPAGAIFRNLRPFVWLFFITFLVHALTTPGQPLFDFGMPVTREGLVSGLGYSMRLSFLILVAALFTLTTPPIELTDALDKLFSPLKRLKVPVHELVLMASLSLRFLPILVNEAGRVKNAQLSRGATLDGRLLARVKAMVPMILPLFVSAIYRAEALALAMEARSYTGGKDRSSYRELTFGRNDFLALGCSFLFLVFAIISL